MKCAVGRQRRDHTSDSNHQGHERDPTRRLPTAARSEDFLVAALGGILARRLNRHPPTNRIPLRCYRVVVAGYIETPRNPTKFNLAATSQTGWCRPWRRRRIIGRRHSFCKSALTRGPKRRSQNLNLAMGRCMSVSLKHAQRQRQSASSLLSGSAHLTDLSSLRTEGLQQRLFNVFFCH